MNTTYKMPFSSHNGLHSLLEKHIGLENALNPWQPVIKVIMLMVRASLPCVLRWNRRLFEVRRGALEHKWTVLGILSRAEESLKLNQSFSFEECNDFLQHVIQAGRLQTSTKSTETISGLQHATNQFEIKYLLILCNIFCWLVPMFAVSKAACPAASWKDQPFPSGRLKGT